MLLQHLAHLDVVLTGTPVQNNLVELWSLLHWLYPTIFTASTERLFESAFNLSQGTYELDFLKATEKLLSRIMLRRTKDSVEGQISIPPKEELTLFIPMTEAQRFWTYRLLTTLDTLDLKDIFTDDLEAGEALTVGRQEVKAQLEAQLQECRTTGGRTRRHFNHFDLARVLYILMSTFAEFKRLMNLLIQLRQVCDQYVSLVRLSLSRNVSDQLA